jgi:Family of unknown function (DUF6502)
VKRLHRTDSRVIARKALLRILEPLAGFVLDSGLSIHEVTTIFREAAVRSIASQQREISRRVNISGISASTGIPRAEVSRVLKSTSKVRDFGDRGRQSTSKVLNAWHQNPKFTNANGQPADLQIYGRGATFEKLVKGHGGGIPIRAMLDELTRTGVIEIKSRQLVRLKSLVAIERGITPRVIKAFGDRTTELLSTLLQNMRYPDASGFVASVSGTAVSQDTIPLIRKELSTRGASFLADIEDILARGPGVKRRSRYGLSENNVSVTIFLHESGAKLSSEARPLIKRRNFRRDK